MNMVSGISNWRSSRRQLNVSSSREVETWKSLAYRPQPVLEGDEISQRMHRGKGHRHRSGSRGTPTLKNFIEKEELAKNAADP